MAEAERIRFHFDEHVDPDVAEGLARHGVDVTTTIEAGLRTADDETQFGYAIRTNRVFVTGDFGVVALAATVAQHSGLTIVNRRKLTIGQQIRGLILIYEVLTPEEMRSHVEYVS